MGDCKSEQLTTRYCERELHIKPSFGKGEVHLFPPVSPDNEEDGRQYDEAQQSQSHTQANGQPLIRAWMHTHEKLFKPRLHQPPNLAREWTSKSGTMFSVKKTLRSQNHSAPLTAIF